jgi:hypothetical protein
MIQDLLERFISPVRQIKGFSLQRILQVGFEKLGYGFETGIPNLDKHVYIPSIRTKSEISTDSQQNGIPNASDYGYLFGEIVSLARKYFEARIAVIDGVAQFRWAGDEYWIKQSTYQMPSVLLEDETPKKYNTDELTKSRLIYFETDDSDWWTLDNYRGTDYEVITQHTEEVDPKKDGLVGFERITFPISLGHVKENLNALEIALKTLAQAADLVTKAFGSQQSFTERIERRVGMLKVSHENTSRPKLLYYNGSIPSNHRDLLSAKVSWNSWGKYNSFVDNNFKRQRLFYEGVTFGFGLSGTKETIRNGYFTMDNGKIGKFVNLKWDWESDQVIADFWIEEVYTTKLKETKVETDG